VASALQAGSTDFLLARSEADRAARALQQIPVQSGNATLDRARAELRDKLPTIRGAGFWLAAAPSILGVKGPSKYLVVLQNPAEIAPTGGFIGAADFLTLRNGSVETVFSGTGGFRHEVESVPPPLPEALYTPEGAWSFRRSNWSPDFPLSAHLERWFYGEDTGRWADGVVSIVDTAIAPILAGTGPVYLPAYHQWVNATNVDALAQHYINGRYHGPSRRGSPDTIRKQFFAEVIAALLQRVRSLPLDRFPALAAALSEETARRDIQLYDTRPGIQSAIAFMGADGGLPPAPGDFLAIVDDNLSYNKLNPYIREEASYHVDIEPDLWLDATLRLRYHVGPSPADLEAFDPTFGLWGSRHDYQDFLRVFVPAGAELEQMTGVDRWAPQPAYGLTQFAGRILVPEGQTRTITVRYRIPANVFAASRFRRYHLAVRHQPGSNLSSLTVSVRAAGGVSLDGGGGRVPRRRLGRPSLRRVLALTADAHFQAPLSGDLHPDVRQLPPQLGRSDPYVPFSDLMNSGHPL
jgi:hypothetical protein